METGGDSEVEADVDFGDSTEDYYATYNRTPTQVHASPVITEHTTKRTTEHETEQTTNTTEPATEHEAEQTTNHTTEPTTRSTTTTHSSTPITTPHTPVTSTYTTHSSTDKPVYTTNPVTDPNDGRGDEQNKTTVTVVTTTPDACRSPTLSFFPILHFFVHIFQQGLQHTPQS